MVCIQRIIETIDNYLEENNLKEISAVEANEILEHKKVLKNSKSRPGKPLRDILRQGLIPNADYRIKPGNKRGFWFIQHS